MVDKPTIVEYLDVALKGANLRQAAIANNIANINTPGYRRSTVQFQRLLAEAIAKGRDMNLEELQKAVTQPRNTPVDANGNDVSLEMEIGEMVKNNTMQKTFMRLLSKLYRQMELAIQGQ